MTEVANYRYLIFVYIKYKTHLSKVCEVTEVTFPSLPVLFDLKLNK
jgi:hypothetical protein